MGRVIVVSNRLPFHYNGQSQTLEKSSGGLVAAISGIKAISQEETAQTIIWVGAMTMPLMAAQLQQYSAPSSSTSSSSSIHMQYHAVHIPKEMYDLYYNGMCNDCLWPLLHYETQFMRYSEEAWEAYVQVNRLFATEVAALANESDLIWVHDFHLFLLPGLLKKLRPQFKIGLFLHVPFPSVEIFRHFPRRREILEHVLMADLVGVHDYSYLLHFSSTINFLLGLHGPPFAVHQLHHSTGLGVFPVGIDTQMIQAKAQSVETLALVEEFRRDPTFEFLVLGVDRMDYIKGIELKLQAFRHFLRQYPDMRGKVRLMQVAVPSRQEVGEYILLKNEVERLIGEINGEFGDLHYHPVHYVYSSISLHELLALYRSARALLITSKRDGMNLVSLEYVAASDPQDPGVVLLSEFAGASFTLGHSLLINPWDFSQTAQKIYQALQMPLAERQQRYQQHIEFLTSYTATDWAQSFLQDLILVAKKLESKRVPILKTAAGAGSTLMQTLQKQLQDKEVVLVLDYDGTIVPINARPEKALLSGEIFAQLERLALLEHRQLLVVSGRGQKFLQEQLGTLQIYMAAEHGAKFFDPVVGTWTTLVGNNTHFEWYESAEKIMQDFTQRTVGSIIERKEFSIAWHYRLAPEEFGQYQARKLWQELEGGLANLPATIIEGKKVIEARAIGANKGLFLDWFRRYIMPKKDYAFLVVGDDRTDEDMFEVLWPQDVSIKVGTEPTRAKFRCESQEEVLPLLQSILCSGREK